ncbi:MAG: CoA transferase [Defluviicoccus sp.]|nr:CoA transferase [Defluviicoccus sp.]MDE0386706.1 CoA transferase [Defluviicoccus sp.]
MSAPLDGLLVLDFSTLLPGPLATLMLAEAGAEVIKVERPGGEEMRRYVPRWGAESVNFAMLNRGKKSLVLDLKRESDRARLRPLLERADVLVEQFRPGVMARLGLDAGTVRELNPRIVYCSITGFGQTGARRDIAAHDLNYIGETGVLSLSMGPGDRPVVPPVLMADIAAGAYPAVLNILLALRQRDATGEGATLDVAMADNLFPFMFWAIGNAQAAGLWPKNGGDLVTGGSPRYRLYPTSDGRVLAAAPLEQQFWEAFAGAVGLAEEWRDDTRDPEGTAAAVAALVAARPASYWEERIRGVDCCCSIVRSLEEALADPHFRARGLFAERLGNDRGEEMPALPMPIDRAFRAALGELRKAPPLGKA